MQEAIKKLIAVDKAAREKVEAAERKRDSLNMRMAELKKDRVLKAKENFSNELAEKEKEMRLELSKEFSKEKIELEDKEVIGNMDKLFNENCDGWAESIFRKVTTI